METLRTDEICGLALVCDADGQPSLIEPISVGIETVALQLILVKCCWVFLRSENE